jgi:hypothetical protein
MNLMRMSLDDLIVFDRSLQALIAAGQRLAVDGVSAVFDLSPGRAVTILTDAQVPGLGGPVVEALVAALPAAPVVAPAAAYDPLRPAAVVVPPPAPETATAGKVTGPFSVAEKAVMDQRAGDGAAEIARDLNRSVQSVALYLNGQKYAKDKVRAQGQPDAAAPGVAGQRPWTAADDDWLVAAISQNQVTRQRTYREMMEHAARTLGRGVAATTARSTGLRDRILERARRHAEWRKPAAAVPPPADPAPAALPPVPPAPDLELVRAVVEAVVPPAPPFDPGVPVWRREIEDRLTRLGNAAPFTPQVDLALLEGLAKGHKLGWISTDLGIDFDALKTRFRQLVPEPGIVAQDRVLTVLRARATAD